MKPQISEETIPQNVRESRFLRACRRESVDATPIWIMRQAGRYMGVYRELRKTHGVMELMATAELAAEVTLQPMRAFDLDAAIIFSDILTPLMGMGMDLEFSTGGGPVIHNPVTTEADVAQLKTPPPEEALPFTLEAIRQCVAELHPQGRPLIGFGGAPFSLAVYAMSGNGHNFQKVKLFMMQQPEAWATLMDKLATVAGNFMLAQARAGASALQMFDSWVGELSPEDYRRYALPYSRKAIEIASAADVPIIHFCINANGMLEDIREAGSDVVGIDWRIDFTAAAQRLGDAVAIQGNLDPMAMLTDWDSLRARAQRVLDQANQRPGHIFNLGHGIPRATPEDHVKRLVDFVHESSRR